MSGFAQFPLCLIILSSFVGVGLAQDEGGNDRNHLSIPWSTYLGGSSSSSTQVAFPGPTLIASQRRDTGSTYLGPLPTFLMSAALPGLGQAHQDRLGRALVFAAVDIAIIALSRRATVQGQRDMGSVESNAHQLWSPAQYATWLNDYADFLASTNENLTTDRVQVPSQIPFSQPGTWTAEQSQRVRRLFVEIRTLEAQLYYARSGAAFSHVLPYFGEQQYYELIGKYFQYAPGWSDYPEWRSADTFLPSIDPTTLEAGKRIYVTDQFYAYASDHAAANDLFRRSQQLVVALIAWHVVSAVDAAVLSQKRRLIDRTSASIGLAPGSTRASGHFALSLRF